MLPPLKLWGALVPRIAPYNDQSGMLSISEADFDYIIVVVVVVVVAELK